MQLVPVTGIDDDAVTFSDSVDGDVKSNQGWAASGSFTVKRAFTNETMGYDLF